MPDWYTSTSRSSPSSAAIESGKEMLYLWTEYDGNYYIFISLTNFVSLEWFKKCFPKEVFWKLLKYAVVSVFFSQVCFLLFFFLFFFSVCEWRLTVTCLHGLHLICSPCSKVCVVYIYSFTRSTLEYHPSSCNAIRLQVCGGLCIAACRLVRLFPVHQSGHCALCLPFLFAGKMPSTFIAAAMMPRNWITQWSATLCPCSIPPDFESAGPNSIFLL